MEKWTQCVEDATTLSQLHLLLEILDTAVLWDKSAEGARCRICRKKGNEDDVLLLCDECNLGFHLFCLRPALTKIPKGEWKCMSCRPVSTARSARCDKVLDESFISYESQVFIQVILRVGPGKF
ncbi:tyrosine-protein kinase BAZ1B [Exaiptasia diaphana]|uniref:Tyrosine-protein kinase BAZ1B n=1 Tax=Exaiptasia diaphana TaxID=2652724 RepID=A0A913YCI3_EXADI|nr:tyrosine-protein kinase BAZ1B [Exaiptasia diaphana]